MRCLSRCIGSIPVNTNLLLAGYFGVLDELNRGALFDAEFGINIWQHLTGE